jgi:hypothetical protein
MFVAVWPTSACNGWQMMYAFNASSKIEQRVGTRDQSLPSGGREAAEHAPFRPQRLHNLELARPQVPILTHPLSHDSREPLVREGRIVPRLRAEKGLLNVRAAIFLDNARIR